MSDSAPPQDRHGRPLRALRISVTDRCNFRCGYCMPREAFGADHAFLPKDELLSFEELERLARIFVSLGVERLRLTGGEPLMRRDLPGLVARLSAIEGLRDLSLTTNGALLPEMAEPLRRAGLKRVTVSLDTLDPGRFSKICDTEVPLSRVLGGIEAARAAGFGPIKLNCVLKRGVNDGEILDLAAFAREAGHTLRFIEFMDVGSTNGWRLADVVPSAEVRALVHARWPLEPLADAEDAVARGWRYADGRGELGLISAVTAPFCKGCDRARLSAEGRLHTCLFATEGLDLRAFLRSGHDDAQIRVLLAGHWRRREDRYSELRSEATAGLKKAEMSYLGG